jgi:hypothetical protein
LQGEKWIWRRYRRGQAEEVAMMVLNQTDSMFSACDVKVKSAAFCLSKYLDFNLGFASPLDFHALKDRLYCVVHPLTPGNHVWAKSMVIKVPQIRGIILSQRPTFIYFLTTSRFQINPTTAGVRGFDAAASGVPWQCEIQCNLPSVIPHPPLSAISVS